MGYAVFLYGLGKIGYVQLRLGLLPEPEVADLVLEPCNIIIQVVDEGLGVNAFPVFLHPDMQVRTSGLTCVP